MNLHNVTYALRNVALWVQVAGANGRMIGTHLWEMDEGEPPPLVSKPSWQDRSWWRPARYAWTPFQSTLDNMFRTGWVRPLCGARSASRRPRAYFAGRGRCEDCVRVATQRGIISLTHNEAIVLSARNDLLQQERLAWLAAGRPDQWPSPSTS